MNCGSCDKFYIGRTYGNFNIRRKKHQSSFINNKKDYNYANHLFESNHSYKSEIDILHIENKGIKYLEALKKNKQRYSWNLLNDQLDLSNSPLLNLFNRKVTDKER